MGSIQEFIRDRKRDSIDNVAWQLKGQGKYAEAAGKYIEEAEIAKVDNDLIYADECRYAFEMWMKAGETEKALEQARNALSGYKRGDWLKGENDYIQNLLSMVSDLNKADHMDEADLLLGDINTYLVSVGEMPATVTRWGKQHKFPDECPHCGGSITYHGYKQETQCTFCNGTVQALD
ncbi:MAG TPA: hypothetical protein VK468_08025 [Pyrinomonadaceae bacterium]|nr:hypothetical protein [Pyrinomonadaceae bacterium]